MYNSNGRRTTAKIRKITTRQREIEMNFAEKLKELRISGDFRVRNVSEKVGISHSYFTDLENGKQLPSGKVIKKLASFFDKKGEDPGVLEYELRCLAEKPPDSLLGSIRENPFFYQQVERAIANAEKSEDEAAPIVLRLPARNTEVMQLAAEDSRQFNVNLPGLPVIGEEAGYILVLFESLLGRIIRVIGKCKTVSNLNLKIVRGGEMVFSGQTDKNGDIDIGEISLSEGDILQLDVPLQFTVKENFGEE